MSTCPRCMNELNRDKRYGGDFDVCTDCGGIWFDPGEMETVALLVAKLFSMSPGSFKGFVSQ